MINARNKVPEHQKFYQTAYANHQRLWKIVCAR
jgi:cytochrome c oxidase subunit VIIa